MNKQFVRNLRWGYGVSLLVLLVVGFISYRTLIRLLDSDRQAEKSSQVIQKLEQSLSRLKDAETGQRGYLLTGNEIFLQPYNGAFRDALTLAGEASELTADRPKQQANIAAIRQIMLKRMNILEAMVAKRRAGEIISGNDMDAGKAAMDAVRTAVDRAESYERVVLSHRLAKLDQYRRLTPVVIMLALLLGALATGISYSRAITDFRKYQHLYEALNAEKEETAALNEELTAANEEIKASNEELSSINEELSEAKEELTAANESLEQRVADRTKALQDSEARTAVLNEELMATNEELTASNEELAEANHELRLGEERKAKLAAIVESSDDAIIGKDLNGIITSWNRGAQQVFGYTEGEIVGKSVLTLIPKELQHEEPLILARLRNREKIDHYETIRCTKDGRQINVSLTISPILDTEGNVIGVSKIARDITAQKQAEQRKNDFIGMASHELKTPLTSLTMLLQVVQKKLQEHPDSFVSEALHKATYQTKKMNGLISGFLNVSRLETGQLEITPKPLDLNDLVAEQIDEIRLISHSHNFNLQATGTIMVNADPEKIGSVISNLLSNAVKYSPRGSSISVSCKTQDDEALVSVRDEGMGISPQDLTKIFDRYYRSENEQMQHISGFGVGLYLSAEIIHRHGGRIWAESEKGAGATFYFTLPLYQDSY